MEEIAAVTATAIFCGTVTTLAKEPARLLDRQKEKLLDFPPASFGTQRHR
jgi:hypothetical protein